MKKMKKRTKVIFIIFTVCVLFLLLYGILYAVNQHLVRQRQKPDELNTENYRFYMPDWEQNIFEDEDYTALDRTIYYTNGAETFPLEKAGSEQNGALFFIDYFDALTHGDSETLNRLYTDAYIEQQGPFAPFTMQRIYSANVNYRGTAEIDGLYGQAELFALSYCIMRNDGTFRRDIESDASRTQLIYLVQTEDGYKIHQVDYYKNRSSDS